MRLVRGKRSLHVMTPNALCIFYVCFHAQRITMVSAHNECLESDGAPVAGTWFDETSLLQTFSVTSVRSQDSTLSHAHLSSAASAVGSVPHQKTLSKDPTTSQSKRTQRVQARSATFPA